MTHAPAAAIAARLDDAVVQPSPSNLIFLNRPVGGRTIMITPPVSDWPSPSRATVTGGAFALTMPI